MNLLLGILSKFISYVVIIVVEICIAFEVKLIIIIIIIINIIIIIITHLFISKRTTFHWKGMAQGGWFWKAWNGNIISSIWCFSQNRTYYLQSNHNLKVLRESHPNHFPWFN